LQRAFLILRRKVLMVLHPFAEVGLGLRWSCLAGVLASSGGRARAATVAARRRPGGRGHTRKRKQHRQRDGQRAAGLSRGL
jgi:hypothetical protein